jgi:cytochrome c biogenesis protein
MAVEPGLEFSTHADPMDKGASSPAGLGARGWLRWIWARMTSMRTALLLLLLLGVAAIPGSLFPQRTSDPMAVSAYIKNNPTLAPWLERFGLFDVYGSAWFSAVYLLLFISLVGCLIPRARQHVRMWRTSPSAPPSALARMPGSENRPDVNVSYWVRVLENPPPSTTTTLPFQPKSAPNPTAASTPKSAKWKI